MNPTLAPAPDAARFLGLLWGANHQLEKLSKRMIRMLGVTGPQRMVLKIVAYKPGISASAIAEAARVHPSTLTGILKRLGEHGLVARSRDAGDARRSHLIVTTDGQAVADCGSGTVEAAMLASLSGLSGDERELVARWLAAFAVALAAERTGLATQQPGRD